MSSISAADMRQVELALKSAIEERLHMDKDITDRLQAFRERIEKIYATVREANVTMNNLESSVGQTCMWEDWSKIDAAGT
ncbi:hypothetical protein AURDEDRAFT_178196 [Auricularia subglabra TFB-10046 SS5]|uniref:Uncharacterized protein n=1 Tax=Auricularia subglabra (strain TFB-10046 / SS5) TaxID=717982 RepID=J0L8M5_AURST|nr:hypothetical protein AURDEDRAFT_178196 [Auricularia subglabra TFB-10046 SS5]